MQVSKCGALKRLPPAVLMTLVRLIRCRLTRKVSQPLRGRECLFCRL